VRGKMERTGVPVLFFIVPAWFFIVIETWRDRSASALSPVPRAFCAAATAAIIVNSLLSAEGQEVPM
jgi:hypothetical protein